MANSGQRCRIHSCTMTIRNKTKTDFHKRKGMCQKARSAHTRKRLVGHKWIPGKNTVSDRWKGTTWHERHHG